MRRTILLLATTALPTLAAAEPPKVATDIAPVHALVSQIMQGVGEPALIVPQGASPHGYAMRPSEARALSEAEIVFWVGPELSPAVERGIDSLAGKAEKFELLEVPGLQLLNFREGPFLDGDAHDGHDDHGHGEEHGEEHSEDHGEEKHADHDDHDHDKEKHEGHDDHDEHADHADHDDDEKHADHDGHDHDGIDPHAWLNPDNLAAWATFIGAELAEHDPANAATYQANAAAEAEKLEALHGELSAKLKPVAGKPFLVFHDAYQYFETAFGVTAGASLLSSEASRPSAESLSRVRDSLGHMAEKETVCIYTEPQFDASLVNSVAEGLDIRVATLDPLGTDLPQDGDLHRAILKSLAESMVECLTGDGS